MKKHLPAASPEVWEFGTFRFEAESGELRRRGRRIRLQPQAARLLEILLRHRGRVVARTQLRTALWPDGVHVDHDHAIDVLVSKVRGALGERAERPHFVETCSGRGYRFRAARRESLLSAARALVAVVPAVDDSASDRADSLLAALVSRLSRDLPAAAAVLASATSRALASEADLSAAAREYGVRWVVVWGFVATPDGAALRAEIVRTADDSLVRAIVGDPGLDLLDAVETVLCAAIIAAVKAELGVAVEPPARRTSSASAAGNEALLDGHQYLLQRTEVSIAKAAARFQRCLDLSPHHAAAWALLGECSVLAVDLGSADPAHGYEQARSCARRALEIEPGQPEATCLMAHVAHRYDWRWDVAEALYLECLSSSPSLALGYHRYAEYLSQHARHALALEHIAQARRLDPLSLPVRAVEAWLLLHARRYADSHLAAARLVDLAPEFALGRFCMGRAALHAGKLAEALEHLEAARRLAADPPYVVATLAVAHARAGDTRQAQRLREQLAAAQVSGYLLAKVGLALGDVPALGEHLEAAYQQRSGWITDLAVDPELDDAHADPAYRAMLARLELVAASNYR